MHRGAGDGTLSICDKDYHNVITHKLKYNDNAITHELIYIMIMQLHMNLYIMIPVNDFSDLENALISNE